MAVRHSLRTPRPPIPARSRSPSWERWCSSGLHEVIPSAVSERRAGNYRPTVDQEWLLLASLLAGPGVTDAWNEVRSRQNLDDIDIGWQRLIPLLYRNIRRHGIDNPCSHVAHRTRHGRYQEHGVRPLVLHLAASTGA
jgi:hypothetical protein